jgi:prepilin-type N-terminal cleavage/methylation domain-containing protein
MMPASLRTGTRSRRSDAARRLVRFQAAGVPALASRHQRGFTLMEIMIVLFVIILASAIAIPAVIGSLSGQRLKSAAEAMRVAWSRAHVKAMKTGRIQVFRYEIGGSKFEVQPWVAADDATEAAVETTPGFGAQPVAQNALDDFQTSTLPEGVTFAAGEAKFDSRAYEVEDFFTVNSQSDGTTWSRPVLFYPDGSASDSYVIVTNEKNLAYRIQLRGLTGTSYVGEIDTLDNLLAKVQPGQVMP